MLTKKEYLAIAEKHWASLSALSSETSLYELEKKFDVAIKELNKDVLEKTLGEVPTNYRKKKK
jgi:predicted kinase